MSFFEISQCSTMPARVAFEYFKPFAYMCSGSDATVTQIQPKKWDKNCVVSVRHALGPMPNVIEEHFLVIHRAIGRTSLCTKGQGHRISRSCSNQG